MHDESEFAPMAWPDVPVLAFGPGQPAALNACVGWVLAQDNPMAGYVEGYRAAAVALFDLAAERGTSPDYLVFPLAFLWRHHLELALKNIIGTGRELEGEKRGFPAHHNLSNLWNEARPHILQCGDPKAPELKNVEAALADFLRIDPHADGFRYPTDTRKGKTLPSAPSHVNLKVLNTGMEAISNFLSGVHSELSERLEYRREMDAEEARRAGE